MNHARGQVSLPSNMAAANSGGVGGVGVKGRSINNDDDNDDDDDNTHLGSIYHMLGNPLNCEFSYFILTSTL